MPFRKLSSDISEGAANYDLEAFKKTSLNFKSKMKLDFGLRKLAKEWRALLTTKHLKQDTVAGLTVACIAIPLSLAIALASGVSPVVGLISAIVAGIVCAFMGGTPLAVSGPAAAMAVLIAANVEQFGLSGLLVIGLICGALQILCGVVGLGSVMKFVPVPVIGGFTAGIGAIILISQAPRALGLPAPDQSHVVDVLTHIGSLIHETNIAALGFAALALSFMRFLPKLNKKLPAPLFAIIVPTLILLAFPIQNISTIGEIPRSLPLPAFPQWPTENLFALILSGFVVFFIASLESLLSSTAVDKISRKGKHDSNQELIGQGFGNVAVSLFGGIPISSVIVRSALNVNSGAHTRRASMIHSLVLIACVFLFAPLIKHIPIAALAGILISVAIKMLDVKSFVSLYKVSKSDSFTYVVTFFSILFLDLLAGVQAGIAAAALIAFFKIAKTHVFIDTNVYSDNPVRCSLEGSLTFLSSGKIEDIRRQLDHVLPGQTTVIDVSQVSVMDVSGAGLMTELLYTLKAQHINVIVKGLSKRHEELILENTDDNILPCSLAPTEKEVLNYHSKVFNLMAVKERLMHGTALFKRDKRHDERELFSILKEGQNPHTLFITCSDSRISPSLITSCDPGELFVVRNVGNVVPEYSHPEKELHSESAAIEFAISFLGVNTVIVCGHTFCGAVKAKLEIDKNNSPRSNSSLDKWLNFVYTCDCFSSVHNITEDTAAQNNVLRQIQALNTYPLVKEKVQSKQLAIFAWYYDIGTRDIVVWSNKSKSFVSMTQLKNDWRDGIELVPITTL